MRKISASSFGAMNKQIAGGGNSGPRSLLSGNNFKPTWMGGTADTAMLFDLIPYTITSKHDPMVISRASKIGDIALMLNVKFHSLGPDNTPILCPKMFGKPCPSCDQEQVEWEVYRGKNLKKGTPESQAAAKLPKAYATKDRSFMWARPYEFRANRWSPIAQAQLFECPPAFFTEAYFAQVNNKTVMGIDIGDAIADYSVLVTPVASGFGKSLDYSAISLEKRNADISPELEAQALCLSEFLAPTTANDILALMTGEAMEEDGQQEQAPRQSAPTQQATTAPAPKQADQTDWKPDLSESATLPVFGQPCPNGGHKFGRDFDRKPECETCQFRNECENVE